MCARKTNLEYTFRLYLNADGQRLLGKGGAQILEAVERYGSIAVAAKKLGMSYKFTWDYLTRMRGRLHKPLVVTHRGGTLHGKKKGGGGATLTPVAKRLLKDFKDTDRAMKSVLFKRKRDTARSLTNPS
jgi:molybdate transport system regulatory protein